MATGARAFGCQSAIDTLHQIINVDPAPLTSKQPNAPVELQRIVAKCLAKDPEERYQSMKEVAIDLRGLRRQLDSGTATTAAASGAASAAPGRPGPVAAPWIAAGAVVAIALLAGAYTPSGQTEAGRLPGQLALARLTASGNVIDATLSGDGKDPAYVEAVAGCESLWLRQVNGMRPIELVQPSEVGFWGLAFSSDGQSADYATKAAAQPTGALFQIPTLGGASRQLLTDIDSTVTFSPDGKQTGVLPRGSLQRLRACSSSPMPTARTRRHWRRAIHPSTLHRRV